MEKAGQRFRTSAGSSSNSTEMKSHLEVTPSRAPSSLQQVIRVQRSASDNLFTYFKSKGNPTSPLALPSAPATVNWKASVSPIDSQVAGLFVPLISCVSLVLLFLPWY